MEAGKKRPRHDCVAKIVKGERRNKSFGEEVHVYEHAIKMGIRRIYFAVPYMGNQTSKFYGKELSKRKQEAT